MLEVLIWIFALLCILIMPLFGPVKKMKKRKRLNREDKDHPHFGINEDGKLELLKGRGKNK
jgi:hypothetical protein